jgi:hypothetical protein
MKYENLSKLLKVTSVSSALNQFDLTHIYLDTNSLNSVNYLNDIVNIIDTNNSSVKILSLQKGVFRSNCIDCLDRTNVVQTVFARQVLHKMLYKLSISEQPSGEPFESFNPVFEATYKRMWADHGDYLSIAYSGTKALKRDFVRTGKRTKSGAIEDGMHTFQRFYINNFCDGYNQDCHDYFLCKLNPKKENFKEHSTIWVKLLTPASLGLALTLYQILVGIALPHEYDDSLSKIILRLLIFIGVIIISFRTLFTNLQKMVIDLPTIDHF